MSTLSARQPEFDFSQETFVAPDNRTGSPGRTGGTGGADVISLPRLPNFDYPTSAAASASRIAGRMNAAAISDSDHQRLLDERQHLLDKELAGTITRHEINRLEYVRWSLDRVDDARYGMGFEMLENVVARYERFQADIEQFYSELVNLRKSGRRR